jgi:hypothetical protein
MLTHVLLGTWSETKNLEFDFGACKINVYNFAYGFPVVLEFRLVWGN